MADLHHLLDQVTEPEEEAAAEDWDDDRDNLAVPTALAEAERNKLDSTTDESAGGERLDLGDLLESSYTEDTTVYARLQKLWSQELYAPEILPFDDETLQAATHALDSQEEVMDQLQTEGSSSNANLDALMGRILKIDSDRAKFLLCGLLKRRLGKIEAYPLHMRENLDRLSDKEVRMENIFALSCDYYCAVSQTPSYFFRLPF
jgi:hypothetical protein